MPPTNYMTLFISPGHASLYFSFLACTLGMCVLQPVETPAHEAYPTTQDQVKGSLVVKASWQSPLCSSSSVALLVLPATTFDSDCVCAANLVFCSESKFLCELSLSTCHVHFTPPSDPRDSVSSVLTCPQALIASWFVAYDPGQLSG